MLALAVLWYAYAGMTYAHARLTPLTIDILTFCDAPKVALATFFAVTVALWPACILARLTQRLHIAVTAH